ncbi:MAG TPA: hypothetical protein VFV96_12365 [Verrucomicrobiae bacterium]|nr:hypothetical protein [Verrucomicrobiae bacterium]
MTTPYRPAVFTTKNDNSIGEPIDGSTGDPVNDYVYGGLVIEGYFSEDPVIKYARFLHFIVSPGIDVEGGSTITVKHCEFEDCSQAIYVPSTSYYPLPVSVQNCLFSGCGTAVYHNGYAQVIGVNLTIDNCSQVVDQSWPETYLTNCVLTDVSDVSAIAGTAYTVVTNASGVYQTAGAGNYYLANGSSYRDWGTTNIDPALVAEIAQMTTYPPTVYANTNFASSTTLSPHVECDTNSMDIGYHYAVLDYALSAATNSSTLTLTNGVVVGLFGTNGITMAGGASLESVGTPLALNRLVHCQLVQEQSPTGVPGAMVWLSGTGTTVDLRSTVLGAVSPVYYVYGSYLPNNVSLRDCELYGGSVALSVYGGGTVSVRNNLFRRVNTGAYYAGNLDMDQNLFWGGSVAFQDWPSTYGVYDNAFDGTDLSNLGLLSGQHHNAFINTSGYSSTNNGNLTLSNFTYSAGALGDFYQSANSPLHNAGSTNAGVLGFYHYTTTTNQVKETNSVVDIGYHYVSLDTATGLPIDSDLDGIPDYLDPDSDGDSLPDDWEIHWFGNLDATASDDPDGDWLTNYEEYLAGSNPSDVMVVAWGIANGGALAVPTNAQNVVSVDGNFEGSLALRADGSVVGWGTGAASLPNWTNIVQLSADWDQVAVVESDGIVSVLNTNDDLPPGDLTNAVQVAAGDGFCVALRASGTVTAWGANDAGQCDVPAGLASAKAVAAGWSHAVALLQDGSVAVWGDNGYGQTNKPSGLTNITAVAAGGLHSLALRADGTVIAWGTGWTNSGSLFNFGQAMVPSGLSNVVSISAGGYHSAALRSDGTVVVWGDLGSIAIPDVQGHIVAIGSGDMHILALRGGRLTPLIVSQPTDQFAPAGYTVEFTAVGTGLAGVHYQWQFNGTNIAGATNGTLTLLNVSSNDEGSYRAIVSTGAGSVLTSDATFTLVRPPVIASTAPANPGEVWITNFFTLNVAATAAGQSQFPLSYQWQFNGTNLASGTSSNYYVYFSPTNEGEFTVGVSNAAGSTNAGPWRIHLLQPGGVAAWGANDYGECDSPYNLTNAISIAAGELHSVAVREDGSVVQWGYHWADVPADLTNAVQVAAGYEHSLALRADGTVTAWGDAGAPNWVPTNLSGVKAVSAGEYHNLALLTNGSVVAWGTSLWGVTNVPANLTNVTAISAGTQHNLALKADGTVVAWGWNDVGQTNVPAGLSNVIAIAAGGMHSLALKSDGTVVGWGYGNDGQCTPPADLTNAMAIAAGWRHSVALREDGTVVGWGSDSAGQCDVPATLHTVKLIAAGGDHTLAAVFSPYLRYPGKAESLVDNLLHMLTSRTNGNGNAYFDLPPYDVAGRLHDSWGGTNSPTMQTNFWLRDVTNIYTCSVAALQPIWQSLTNTNTAHYVCTAISPRHAITAGHVGSFFQPGQFRGLRLHKAPKHSRFLCKPAGLLGDTK